MTPEDFATTISYRAFGFSTAGFLAAAAMDSGAFPSMVVVFTAVMMAAAIAFMVWLAVFVVMVSTGPQYIEHVPQHPSEIYRPSPDPEPEQDAPVVNESRTAPAPMRAAPVRERAAYNPEHMTAYLDALEGGYDGDVTLSWLNGLGVSRYDNRGAESSAQKLIGYLVSAGYVDEAGAILARPTPPRYSHSL